MSVSQPSFPAAFRPFRKYGSNPVLGAKRRKELEAEAPTAGVWGVCWARGGERCCCRRRRGSSVGSGARLAPGPPVRWVGGGGQISRGAAPWDGWLVRVGEGPTTEVVPKKGRVWEAARGGVCDGWRVVLQPGMLVEGVGGDECCRGSTCIVVSRTREMLASRASLCAGLFLLIFTQLWEHVSLASCCIFTYWSTKSLVSVSFGTVFIPLFQQHEFSQRGQSWKHQTGWDGWPKSRVTSDRNSELLQNGHTGPVITLMILLKP